MKLNIFILCLLTALALNGCSKKDDPTQKTDKEKSIDSTVRKRRRPVPRGEKPSKRKPRPEHHKKMLDKSTIKEEDKILSAEEQLKQYYEEKGIEYPSKQSSIEQTETRTRPVINKDSLPAQSDTKTSVSQKTTDTYSLEKDQEPSEYKEKAKQISNSQTKSVYKNNPIIKEEDYPDQPDYSDAEPPEIISVTITPTQATSGSNLTISVQAVDNLSGIASIYGRILSPSGHAKLSFYCSSVDESGNFVGKATIPQNAEQGEWVIKSIKTTDNVHNSKTYSQGEPGLENVYVEITDTDSDTTPPNLVAIYAEPTEINAGEKVRFTIEATDNKSGVGKAYGVLISPSGNARISFACRYIEELEAFDGYVNIPKDAEAGFWSIGYVRIEDKAKNSKSFNSKKYGEIINNAKIQVYSNNSDSTPPVLENVIISPSTVVYEDQITVIVDASDDISGIKIISGRISSPSASANIPFACHYDEPSGTYKTNIIIQNNSEVGLWKLDYIMIVDNARNQTNFVRHNNEYINQATFEVLGE